MCSGTTKFSTRFDYKNGGCYCRMYQTQGRLSHNHSATRRDTGTDSPRSARILLVNTELLEDDDFPQSIRELANEKWRGKIGMAKPLFGTTATHATVLFHLWGVDEATRFFQSVAENAQILSGNKQVAISVASGQLAWGITDTDDANVEILKGQPVRIVYPDQAENEMGTLFIPNTISIVAGGPHVAAAKRLVEFVLSPPVESSLAQGPSAQIPLNPNVKVPVQVSTPDEIRTVEVDYGEAAESWDAAAPVLRDIFFNISDRPN